MSHGYPDWGGAAPVSTIYGIQDLSELAARLGSIVTFDRRGNVIFLEDFESGTERWLTTGDVGAGQGWSAKYARNGGFCYRIETSKASSSNTGLYYNGARPRLSTIGLEFAHTGGANWNVLQARITLYDSTHELNAWLRYHASDHTLDIYADGGYYIPIGTYQHPSRVGEFFILKLVADFEALTYKRLIANHQEIDLSSHTIYPIANTNPPFMMLQITLSSNASGVAYTHIDDIIVTQNEP